MDNSLVVSNGAKRSNAIAQAEQSPFIEELDFIGIEVVDLKKDKIASIESKIIENETAKILAINASSKAEILSAIAAGASGAFSEKIVRENVELAIAALKRELVLVDSKKPNVFDFLILPRTLIFTKLEQLQQELATTMVWFWRKKPLPEDIKVEPIVESWMTSDDLVTTVSMGIKKFCIESLLDRCLNPTKADLDLIVTKYKESYFSSSLDYTNHGSKSILATIRLNAYELKERLANEIRELFVLSTRFGPSAVEQLLKSAIYKLRKYEIHWETQHQAAKSEASRYDSSYHNLAIKIASGRSQHNFESALRALNLFYSTTIRSEVYRGISYTIFELVCELDKYYKQVKECDRFLLELTEEWGNPEIKSTKIDTTLQSRFFLLRNELESSNGSLFTWCDRPQLKDSIVNKILGECRILALEIIVEQYNINYGSKFS